MFLNVKQNNTMKKILCLILFNTCVFTHAQSIYGLWVNQENEFLRIEGSGEFLRFTTINKKIVPITQGQVFEVDKELRVIRRDTTDTYDLCFYLGNETMVICRPRSKKAWLWNKLSDL